ncbi:MAG: ATP-binding cassette domain-containing protein [Alphaproteobacteria bacterium]|nr:ATP-binding cassette domain-containing protein [Alphaproteobacteria bacterium]MBU2272276.1 ATP-binding cassette domain-containing protein [Alphaproteobacteria bacterium]MBU2418063.1 ATP-binding cassette domain-containing protein [Alphaproteobacteria bacterium]
MSALVLQSLVAGRAGFRLPALDLTARSGEVVALIGPNGAGKTTLMKTLAGLIPPVSGRLDRPGAAAYLPPPGAVSAGFSALHLTALGRAGRRRWSPGLAAEDIEAARAALTRLDIADLADRPFDRLSSGQQQLVLIARLFVQDAPVCLLDEPLALLDPAHAQAVETAVRTLAREGRIVLASSHHLPFAARADRVLAIGPDQIEAAAPAQALAPDRVRALFGVEVSGCPCCGQALG